MSRPRNRTYKRTWKNLLINKRYQLRFTLFMVVLSSLLMSLLGWWVMTVAARATTVAVNNVVTACQDLPGREPPAASAAPAPATTPEEAPSDGKRPRPVVTIDDSGMQEVPPAAGAQSPSAPSTAEVGAYDRCQGAVPGKVKKLEDRQRLIFWVLIGVGVLVTIALLLYGIKMTHKVAGPLHKVTLYMGKLRSGLYDVVYNLRKGDQLVGFYEHFKGAHAGMRSMQEADVVRIRALVAAADQVELAARSPELAAALDEVRALLDRKEKSLA